MSDLPVIGITMGDPAGIGPEIIIKALIDPLVYKRCRPAVLGDFDILASTISDLDPYLENHSPLSIKIISTTSSITASAPRVINLIPVSTTGVNSVVPGQPTVEGGKAMVKYIITAVEMIQRRELSAMVTCPINKALMHTAGYSYEGHTQLIAHLTNASDYVMMLAGQTLRVALVTIHCAFKNIPAALNTETIYKTITITNQALHKDFGLNKPRLAVAALNPHAGEQGLFGSEEDQIIQPAINRARRDGCLVSDPLPADTVFFKAASTDFDAVIAMYHDQGLIPLKLLHFSDAVNVTLGLPIVRTSVDHGTAYDIAGTGQADPSSLVAAIRLAADIAKNRSHR